jgi:hypothetical protein
MRRHQERAPGAIAALATVVLRIKSLIHIEMQIDLLKSLRSFPIHSLLELIACML